MKGKLLILGLLLASLVGYLQWGHDGNEFVYQLDWAILCRLFTDPRSVMHPLILLPLIGQVLLLAAMLQRQPGRALVIISMIALAILYLLLLFIGLAVSLWSIVLSTVPFFVMVFFVVRWLREGAVNALKD